MVASTIAAGVFDDGDHNSTQKNLVDILEPAGKLPPCYVPSELTKLVLGISWRAYMEGYTPLTNGSCNPLSKNATSGYAR